MKEPFVFTAHDSYVLGLLFTKDGSKMVSIGMDNAVILWSTVDWRIVNQFVGHDNSANSMGLTPDEKILATGSSDNTVKIWSFPDGELLHTLQDRKKTVPAIDVSSDGRWIAAASYGGRFMVWTIHGQPVLGVKVGSKNLASIRFAPNNQIVAVSGLGDDVTLWEMPSGQQIGTLAGHKIAVSNLQFLNGGQTLVSTGYDQSVIFWDSRSWQPVRTLQVKEKGFRGLIFSPDENTAALSSEGKVQLISVDDWSVKSELPVSTKVISAMAYSKDGRLLAIGGADKKIRIFENLD